MNDSSEREEFLQIFHDLKEEVLQSIRAEQFSDDTIEWVKEIIEYNCTKGKLIRGISVVQCTKLLFGDEFNVELMRKASILGWCVEWLQAFLLVADDIMDNSTMRRGQTCWYRLPKVQMIAINDAFLLESFVFQVLRSHFQKEHNYIELFHLFHDTIRCTELGQLLDLTAQPLNGASDLDRFTIERYRKTVIYKTAYYTFDLPLACAMLLRGLDDPSDYKQAREICLEIGEYFQVQDDYLDCFGDEVALGKVGTDIQDNKCSWLVVQALSLANNAQRAILKEHYGQSDDASISQIKQLYKELNLQQIYRQYEQSAYDRITARISQIDSMPQQVFENLVKRIFKRTK